MMRMRTQRPTCVNYFESSLLLTCESENARVYLLCEQYDNLDMVQQCAVSLDVLIENQTEFANIEAI